MAKDPEQRPENQDKSEDEIQADEVEEVTDSKRPPCPQCGWHDTRLSHTTTTLDSLLRAISLHAFRCRSCGNRFRAFRRSPSA